MIMKEEGPIQHFQHHVKRKYNVVKNKRVFINEEDNKSIKAFSINFSFNMSPQCTEEYRRRHGLSLNDYRKIFKCIEVNQLWMMAIYNGLEVTTSAIQSNSSTPINTEDSVTYSGNTQFKSKLENYLSSTKILSTVDRLVAKKDKHKPPLPVHFVTLETLQSFPTPRTYYNSLYKWKDLYLLPFAYYNGYLKMISVLPRHVHECVYSKSKNFLSQPFEFLVNGIVYSGTCEYLLLQTKENHQKLLNMTNNTEVKEYENALYKGNQGSPYPL